MAEWMQTRMGKKVAPWDLTEDTVDLFDIAWALSMQCRYAGHSMWHYSVAQHSVLISRVALELSEDRTVALRGLLHDATEAYLVDLPNPIKARLPRYRAMEEVAAQVIARKFGLDRLCCPFIKTLDIRILHDESQQLMVEPPEDWNLPFLPLGVEIEPWTINDAREEFLQQAELLGLSCT